ncbi:MAG: alpha-amylase family glycosyl hydrolase, partial [Alphaproteobacteria bacterium]
REDWWRGAVIYQIYPRSFADANGDGIGDLAGIAARLDYVATLGVDAIWISPFFESPMKDFGYDISNYRAVDAIFGTLGDFERLVERAHALGLKVIIDQVLSHTSDAHPWFRESRQSRENPKADWYVWADARADGTPPNNWLSVFGGPAWQWEPRRGQYYLHNFLAAQPDLNFHNGDVVRAVLAEAEVWLERGVDGFRLDAANFYFHDPLLRDNPGKGEGSTRLSGAGRGNPYGFQQHLYDKTRPESLGFLERLRALADRHGAITIGEVSDDDSLATAAAYTKGGRRLHMAYTFDLLAEKPSAAHVRERVEYLESHTDDGWPCWSFSNHDVRRVVSRWGDGSADPRLAAVLMALLLSLRGSICVYQGEELGLPEAEIPYELLKDPLGIAFYPEAHSRDGCRTPMPWHGARPHGGFSETTPWLPVPEAHLPLAVDAQEPDPNSALNAARRFLAWRKGVAALLYGGIRFEDAPEDAIVLRRELDGERMVGAFNLADRAVEVAT